MRFYAVTSDPAPCIIAEVASYPGDEDWPPVPVEVERTDVAYFTAPELDRLEGGAAMLAAWRAGDDARWATRCAETDATVEAQLIVDRAAWELMGPSAFQ